MAVGTQKDASLLAAEGADLDEAIACGSVTRAKVRGRWLFLQEGDSVNGALDEAERCVGACLDAWLLAQNPYLSGAAAKRSESPVIGKGAMPLLMQELCAQRRLAGLGLVSQSYQPYIAFWQPKDSEDIERQVEALFRLVKENGQVSWRDLPDPISPREQRAWRMSFIAHGEFLALGWLPERGRLSAW